MSILTDIRAEIQRAEEKHGPLPIHVSPSAALVLACSSLEQIAREDLDGQTTAGSLAILAEEVGEAARAETTADLRAELVQVVAVGIRWIGQIDGLSAADCIPPQIVSTPDTIGGAPRIDGTRIPASLILAMFAAGRSETEIVADYPSLTPAQILACLAYAAENVSAAANPSIMEALGLPTDDSPKNAVEQIRRLREERNTFRRELREYQEDARVNGDRAAAMMEALPRNRFAGGTRLDEMVIRVCEMLASAERERDAYRRAKAENDERFQLEAGEQRARADAAEARLAAILAPVEGVDLEEVLRLDATAARTLTAAEDRDSTLAYAAPVLAREVARRRDLCRRLLPARYIAADGQVMDPDRCTPHALDCAECGRGRAHDEACLGVQPTPAEEVARLRARLAEVERERGETRAEAEELRLTLAAEQGRAEGAPSAGWRSAGGDWLKGRARVRRTNSSWWWFIYAPQPNDHKQTSAEGRESSARAAMLAADKAHEK